MGSGVYDDAYGSRLLEPRFHDPRGGIASRSFDQVADEDGPRAWRLTGRILLGKLVRRLGIEPRAY